MSRETRVQLSAQLVAWSVHSSRAHHLSANCEQRAQLIGGQTRSSARAAREARLGQRCRAEARRGGRSVCAGEAVDERAGLTMRAAHRVRCTASELRASRVSKEAGAAGGRTRHACCLLERLRRQ